MLPIIEDATPSAQQINASMDVLSQDAYAIIPPTDEEESFNATLEGLSDPTPTPMDTLDVKF